MNKLRPTILKMFLSLAVLLGAFLACRSNSVYAFDSSRSDSDYGESTSYPRKNNAFTSNVYHPNTRIRFSSGEMSYISDSAYDSYFCSSSVLAFGDSSTYNIVFTNSSTSSTKIYVYFRGSTYFTDRTVPAGGQITVSNLGAFSIPYTIVSFEVVVPETIEPTPTPIPFFSDGSAGYYTVSYQYGNSINIPGAAKYSFGSPQSLSFTNTNLNAANLLLYSSYQTVLPGETFSSTISGYFSVPSGFDIVEYSSPSVSPSALPSPTPVPDYDYPSPYYVPGYRVTTTGSSFDFDSDLASYAMFNLGRLNYASISNRWSFTVSWDGFTSDTTGGDPADSVTFLIYKKTPSSGDSSLSSEYITLFAGEDYSITSADLGLIYSDFILSLPPGMIVEYDLDPVLVTPTPMLTVTPSPEPALSLEDYLYLTDPDYGYDADSFSDLVNGFDTSIASTSAFAFVTAMFTLIFNFFNNAGFSGWIFIVLAICLLSFVLGHGHS